MVETVLVRRNIALNLDDEYVVLSCQAVTVDDVFRLGCFLGVAKDKVL